MLSLTTRELRVIAAILDGLNKARAFNARMGVHVTPNVFTARFPTGHTFVVRWTAGVHSEDPSRRRAIEQAARHRDGYQIDLGTQPDYDNVVKLANPQPAKRSPRVRAS